MTLFNTRAHSYRDLPVRYAEFATLYRYEKSGELNGLTRVRSLTQDDAHVFCTEDQIQEEFRRALEIIRETLETYGFTDYSVQLSMRDPDDTKYIADEEKWSRAENELRAATRRRWHLLRRSLRRGRLLRPESRLHGAGRAGPRMAALDHSGGLLAARPARLRVRRGGRPGSHAGTVASGGNGFYGAVYGGTDRALRRRLPAVAFAGSGRCHPDHRPARRLRPQSARPALGSRYAGRGGRFDEQHAEEDPGKTPVKKPPFSSSSVTGKKKPERSTSGAGARSNRRPWGSESFWRRRKKRLQRVVHIDRSSKNAVQ